MRKSLKIGFGLGFLLSFNGLSAQEATGDSQGAVGRASNAQSSGPASAAQNVTRITDLAELGYQTGLELEGLTGSRDLFFAMPSADQIESLSLRLPIKSGSAFESRRSLRIEAGDQTIYTRSLPTGNFEDVIDLTIDPALVKGGFLNLRIRYSGAITEDRCVDQRIAGAFLLLDSSSALTANLRSGAVDQVNKIASVMPARAEIVLPANGSEEQAAAALTLALAQPNAQIIGISAAGGGGSAAWDRARISFASASSPSLNAQWIAGQPALQIGGKDPAGAARLLRTQWRAALGAPSANEARSSRGDAAARERITLADLGADTGVQSISERGAWNTVIPVSAVPAGQSLEGVRIDALVANDGGQTPAIINVLLNGLLLGSAEAIPSKRTSLNFDFPDGSISSLNDLEVSVTRQVAGGDCRFEPQGYPAQLLPSSSLKTGSSGDPVDFSDLASTFNAGFTVVVDNASQIASVSRLIQPLANSAAEVTVSYGEVPSGVPYVYVSDTAPQGSDPAIRFDKGAVELEDGAGASVVSGEALAGMTIVQLVEDGGEPVLWIRPGSSFNQLSSAQFDEMTLSYGDVALIADNAIDLSFSTQRDRLVDIRYPDSFSLSDFMSEYRLWFIGLGWILASLGFIYILRRIYSSKKSAD